MLKDTRTLQRKAANTQLHRQTFVDCFFQKGAKLYIIHEVANPFRSSTYHTIAILPDMSWCLPLCIAFDRDLKTRMISRGFRFSSRLFITQPSLFVNNQRNGRLPVQDGVQDHHVLLSRCSCPIGSAQVVKALHIGQLNSGVLSPPLILSDSYLFTVDQEGYKLHS